MSDTPQICDYEGSDYRTDFWEGRGRDYEDLVERQVLQAMLPQKGKRLLEIGGGFGRLTNEYAMYDEVVLLDYSFSQLQYAREQFGDERTIFVAADAYKLPFRPHSFDGATMIRVIHHMVDAPEILRQVRRILADDGMFILEYANKRNLKAIVRHWFGRQKWNPHTLDPVEFVELNLNFHPQYIATELAKAGFVTGKRVPVSFFRIGSFKRAVRAERLAKLDSVFQRTGWTITPSIFTRNHAVSGNTESNLHLRNRDDLFLCPESRTELRREGDLLISETGLKWAIRDGIYDFKQPVE